MAYGLKLVGGASLATVAAVLLAGAAQAQSQDTQIPPPSERPAADADRDNEVTEVIVTARRREETIQDTPISVTALTSADLAAKGLRDVSEVALFTPGFSMQNIQGGTEQPFIRGMATTSFERTLQTASSLQDGVYSSALGRTVFFPDLERIEVIRGPQAALFGRATFAGAINYVLKAPTETFQGQARVTVGEHERLDAHVSTSGPIIADKLFYRVSLNTENYGGEYVNRLDGQLTGIIRRRGATAALRFTPTQDLEINFRLLKTEFRDDGQVPEYLQPSSTLNCFPNAAGVPTYYCGELIVDPSLVSMNLSPVNGLAHVDGGYQNTDQLRATLVAEYDLQGYALTSTTAYVDQTNATFCDCDYSDRVPLAGAFHSLFKGEIKNLSQEFRLSSPDARRLRWLLGAYYFKEESFTGRFNVPTVPVIPYLDVETQAVFGSVAYDLSDRLTVNFDARYQQEEQNRSAIPGNPAINVEYTAFLPRVIVEFEPNEKTLVYASASKGNQPGQFNTGTNIPANLVKVDEEELWNYEVGAKARLLDNRLQLAAAAYRIDWTNQVFRSEFLGSDGRIVNLLANLGETQINGLELEGQAVLGPGLTANATYAFIDAEYVDFLSPNALRVYRNAQVAGRRLPNTPRHQGSFATTYTRPLGGVPGYDGYVRADYAYRGRQFVSEINQAYIGELHLLNLHTGIRSDRLTVNLTLNNALNSDVPEFATRFSDTNSPGLSRFAYLIKLRNQRAVNLSLTYNF